MKYGLYYFKNSPTIGDDIWAYAQSLYYPHIDYLIDNTSIYSFKSDNDEDVASVFSGFIEPYNHEYSFFPSKNIIPFFISSYFRSTMWEFVSNPVTVQYLKAYQPIGIRSLNHIDKFNELGIESYFSGCITLTLPQLPKSEGNYICCVDVSDEVVDCIKSKYGSRYEIKRITHNLIERGMDEYTSHCSMNIEERFDIVKDLLKLYANAHCVITSRLHCALPCLTQNTPVLFALPKNGTGIIDTDDRLSCFYELLHVTTYEDIISGSSEYDIDNPPKNSDAYMSYRDKVQTSVNDFIARCENGLVENKYPFIPEEAKIKILEDKIYQLKNLADTKNTIIKNLSVSNDSYRQVILDLQKRLRKYEVFNEWENLEHFNDSWSARSKLMSMMINTDSKSLLDIGCGEMHIRKYIPADMIYYGLDYKKRNPDTIVCDLTSGCFPKLKADTVFIAGVLEFLGNWKDVLRWAASICTQVVMSYSTIEAAPMRYEMWVNDISEKDLISFMNECGFELVEKRTVTENSDGFNFRKSR